MENIRTLVPGIPSYGLFFEAVVDDYTDVNNFACSALTGFGNDYFANHFWVWVKRDAGGAGAAPQGQRRLITDYNSITGFFTHDAFTAALAVGDTVCIVHETLAMGDLMEGTYDLAVGELVQVPFFVEMDTIVNDVITLFSFDALGVTIREVYISMYLPLEAAATFTPTWEKTRAGDLITFVTELVPALAAIATPAANAVYSYKLGEIAQGLEGRFRIAQDNAGAPVTIDAFAVVLMEV